MGEFADYYNEMCEDEPYWPGGDEEPEDPPVFYRRIYRKPKKTISCRCCGNSGLNWKQISGKWTLFQGKEIHKCPVNPLNRKQPA